MGIITISYYVTRSLSCLTTAVGHCNKMPINVRFYSVENNTSTFKKSSKSLTNLSEKIKNNVKLSGATIYNDKILLTKSLVNKTMAYVEEVSYMDDVRKAQEDVMAVNNSLQESSETKRKILLDLHLSQEKLYKLHEELLKSSRGTDRYVQLVQSERELLMLESTLKDSFRSADENEHQLLRRLTTAINNSYQKEKIHTNFLKVWALVGTLFASIFTLIGSYVAYCNHTSKFGMFSLDIKQHVNEIIKSEIGDLNTSIAGQINAVLSKQNQILEEHIKGNKNSESWGSYFKKHGATVYRWVLWRSD